MSNYEHHPEFYLSAVCDEPYYNQPNFYEDTTLADVVEHDMQAAMYAFVESPLVGGNRPRTAAEFTCTAFLKRMKEEGEEL